MRKILSIFMNKIRGIASDTRGNIAITFVLSATVALSLVGFGIDYSRTTNAREKLQWAVDSAALTVKRTHLDTRRAKGATESKTYAVTQGDNVFKSNVATVSGWLKDGTALATFAWGSNDAAQVTGTAKVSTLFGGLIGYSAVDIKAYAEVAIGQSTPVEVSLVLDNTASLFDKDVTTTPAKTGMTLLRNASKKFVNTLFDASTTPDLVRVAIVPWATTVNVKSEAPLAWNTSGKQSTVIPDRGTRSITSNASISRDETVSYVADDYLPTVWRGCISGAVETSGYDDSAMTNKFAALNIARRDMNTTKTTGRIGLITTQIKTRTECVETHPTELVCVEACTSCGCKGQPACPPAPCTDPCGCNGENKCGTDDEPAKFMPRPPAVPISLRNIAPKALKLYPAIEVVQDCNPKCTRTEDVEYISRYCSTLIYPDPGFTHLSCDQSLYGGRKNIYLATDPASPNNKCLRRLATTDLCEDCVGTKNCDKAENWEILDVKKCIADPNEFGYTGEWCPWVPDSVKNWTSFGNASPVVGPNVNCPIPMLGLSGNRTQVLDTLDRMTPVPHGTHADVGLRWGMRTLSPEAYWTSFFGLGTRPAQPWQMRDGQTVSSEKGKVMILITDGINEPAKDIPGYWGCKKGYAWSTECISTDTQTDFDGKMKSWCSAIRAKGVHLYAILLNNTTNTTAKTLIETCAPGKAYSINSSELDQLLTDIVEVNILKLYLRK